MFRQGDVSIKVMVGRMKKHAPANAGDADICVKPGHKLVVLLKQSARHLRTVARSKGRRVKLTAMGRAILTLARFRLDLESRLGKLMQIAPGMIHVSVDTGTVSVLDEFETGVVKERLVSTLSVLIQLDLDIQSHQRVS